METDSIVITVGDKVEKIRAGHRDLGGEKGSRNAPF